jgi:hypothetical protein
MYRLAVVPVLLLVCVCGHAEQIPFLAREHADTLVVQTSRRDTCAVSDEQMYDAVSAVVRQAGIEPSTRDHAPVALRLAVSAACLPDGGAILRVQFLDDVKGTMTTHLTTRVDASSSGLLLAGIRNATEEAIADYVDSNPELSTHRELD